MTTGIGSDPTRSTPPRRRKNPFPADGTLRLGLIPSQTRIKKSALELKINHNKKYKKRNGFSCRREKKINIYIYLYDYSERVIQIKELEPAPAKLDDSPAEVHDSLDDKKENNNRITDLFTSAAF